MYMRNSQGRLFEGFPSGYNGIHDVVATQDEDEAGDNVFDKLSEDDKSPARHRDGHQDNGILSRIFPSKSGNKNKLIGELEADDLILIGLLIFLLNEGADIEIILVIGFLLVSELIEL